MPRQGVDSLWKELTTRLKIFTLDAQVGELVCNKLGHMFAGVYNASKCSGTVYWGPGALYNGEQTVPLSSCRVG